MMASINAWQNATRQRLQSTNILMKVLILALKSVVFGMLTVVLSNVLMIAQILQIISIIMMVQMNVLSNAIPLMLQRINIPMKVLILV